MKPNVTKLVVCDPRGNALLQLNGWRGSVEPVRQWEPSHPFFPFPLPLASIGEEKAKCQEESLTPYLLSFLAVRCPRNSVRILVFDLPRKRQSLLPRPAD